MKQNVFNCLLKEAREVAVVTLVGRLFHARAAATRKERSPIVIISCKYAGSFACSAEDIHHG